MSDDTKGRLDQTPPGGIPRGGGEEDGLDIARGEVNDEDLTQLELAIDSVDFAARRATPERQARLASLVGRLTDVAAQIAAGQRTAGAERLPPSPEQKARWQQLLDEGVAAGERGDLDTARSRLEEAVRLDGDGAEGLFNLGVVYGLFAHKNVAKSEFFDDYTRDEVWTEKAKRCYDRVLELDPKHTPSLKNLATLYAMRDERDLAVELLRRLVAIEPGDDLDRALISEARAQLSELESI